MIRAVTQGKEGPVVVLGVTEGNVERFRAGYPLDVKLGELFAYPGSPFPPSTPVENVTFAILYGETHEAVVQQFIDAGVELPEGSLEQARAIDAQG